jgi:hypothetical protein
MAALYRQRQEPSQPDTREPGQEVSSAGANAVDESDVFVAHASEDKEVAARPLAQALIDRGWTVWLDELRLTVGDSLSRRIDAALARSRFGVVILSPAFFAKEWPQKELAGLAAREVAAGTKVILPVWHEVDQSYLVKHSPLLADRVGAEMTAGIDHVADQISLALQRAGQPGPTGAPTVPVIQSVVHTADPIDPHSVEIVTAESIEDELIAFIPEAGELLQGIVTQHQVDDWASRVGIGIRARGPRGEEEMFHAEGHHLDQRAELEAKVRRLQNHIIPKVRAGEWM